MNKRNVLLAIVLCLGLVAAVWAGMPPVYGKQMLENILIGEGFSETEIMKILSLPTMPDIDCEKKIMRPGHQLWVNEDMSMAVIFDVKDGCCVVSHELFDHSGDKR